MKIVHLLFQDERDYETEREVIGVYETPQLAEKRIKQLEIDYNAAIKRNEVYVAERWKLRRKLEDEVVDLKLKPIGRRQAHVRNGLKAFDDSFDYEDRYYPTKYYYNIEYWQVEE